MERGRHITQAAVDAREYRCRIVVHHQIRKGAQTEGLQQAAPGITGSLGTETNVAACLLVAHVIGASGHYGGAPRCKKTAQRLNVPLRHVLRFDPEQDVDIGRHGCRRIHVDLNNRPVLTEVTGHLAETGRRRQGEGSLWGRSLQMRLQQRRQMRQMGVLDALDEDVVAPCSASAGHNQRGPDLDLALGVVDDLPYAYGADASSCCIPCPCLAGVIGVDDAITEGAACGIFHGCQQGPCRLLHILQV